MSYEVTVQKRTQCLHLPQVYLADDVKKNSPGQGLSVATLENGQLLRLMNLSSRKEEVKNAGSELAVKYKIYQNSLAPFTLCSFKIKHSLNTK